VSNPTKDRAALSPDRRELLARLLAKKGLADSERLIIPRRTEPELYPPLSFVQRRLWFLDQLEPGNPAYNIAATARLSGKLDVRALEETFNELLRRHEALRTSFTLHKGEPVQRIAEAHRLALPIIDLESLPEAEREANRITLEEAQRSFDLTRSPLLRVTLLRLSKEEHLMLLVMHHIISDGWSLGVLIKEITILYTAFAQGRSSPLAPLPIQYADYAHWQREWLRGQALTEQLAYWRRKLAGAPPALELPTDRARPPVQGYGGAAARVELDAGLTGALKALGRTEGATLYMLLLAGFQALLHRYTAQDEVVVGTPVAGRSRPEVEQLIGCFVNTVAVRADFGADPSYQELVRQVREVTLEAYEHQEVPFERLV